MIILVSILIVLCLAIYFYYKDAFQYWEDRNMPCMEASIPVGSVSLNKRQIGEQIKLFYDTFKKQGQRHGGAYLFAKPMYIPVDLDLIKTILVKDAAYFLDRGLYYNEKDDPLSAHLFALGGTKWRNLRIKSTPAFTSGRMKMMFHIVVECGKLLKADIEKKMASGEAIDIKEELQRFTTDAIGSCAFGLECNSFDEVESPFRKYCKGILTRKGLNKVIQPLAFAFPNAARFFRYKLIPSDCSDFFLEVCRKNVQYREEHNVTRNDFLQLMIDLKNNKLDHEITETHDGTTLTMNELAAQCFIFFLAGFETSSTLMTFALLELAQNQDIQDRLREEILSVLSNHNDEITYDSLTEMKYLQQVLDESLRLYPPFGQIPRECTMDYEVPGTVATVGKGVFVTIPVLGIHRDEQYYPNPLVFDPERFSEENKKKRHPFAFLPFGEGPRICIGLRFGYMQAKVGLITLLKNFKFTLDKKTQLPVKFVKNSAVTEVQGGVWVNAERI